MRDILPNAAEKLYLSLQETSCGTLGWLGSLSELEGKLACPNPRCLVRVGHYNWSGSQCSCTSSPATLDLLRA
eukprot:36713-Eustigmatos_ZCMA.PRE.1